MDSTQIYLAQLANENSAKQMNWQKSMSDTSHQREVADLKNAGLNPVLSSNSGAQSYTTSVDSAVNAIGNIESSKISSNAAIQAASIAAQAQRDAAAIAANASIQNTKNKPVTTVAGLIDKYLGNRFGRGAVSKVENIVKQNKKIANAQANGSLIKIKDINKATTYQIDNALNSIGVSRHTNTARQIYLNFMTTGSMSYLNQLIAMR